MSRRRIALVLPLALLFFADGCKNPDFCEGNPHNDCRLMFDAPTGPAHCTGDPDCKAPTAVCDLGATNQCVQCTPTEASACGGTTPACVDNACQKCTSHSQCPASNVCLPDGSCADATMVAYVAPSGSGTTCTMAAPCGTLDDALNTNRPTVKMEAGTVADNKTTTIDGKAVTIVADMGAKLGRQNPGIILQVQNDGADVQIFDLEITLGTGMGNPAISVSAGGAPKLSLTRVTVDGNQDIGISFAAAGTLTLSRSTVRGNSGGGITISGAQFDISNSIVVQNGGAASILGGVSLSNISVAGTHRFDFNTIAANQGMASINTGINCSIVTVPVVFDSDIIFGNPVSGGGQQIGTAGGAMCSAIYSDISDTTPGTGNINMDPMFVAPAQKDFHLMATSPAKDAADPAATLAVDFDGDTRPQGPRSDIGADEVKQ